MSKHTSGPWRWDARPFEGHEYYVAAEWSGRGGPKLHGSAGAVAKLPPSKFHDVEANARLIAAAPELLEALKLVERNTTRADWPDDIHAAIVGAIAKATGEQA